MNRYHPAHRQSGAVAIMTALSLVLLIAMIGLVVDLGYLYTRKTDLQNAADAAALAGARKLEGTVAGITAARDSAIALASANNSDLGGTQVAINEQDIEFGPTPDGIDTNSDGKGDGTWYSYADASTNPAHAAVSYFIKVDVGEDSHSTWFMGVVSSALASTKTFGRAVAGRYLVDVAPIAACALDGSAAKPCNSANCGYQIGKGYKLSEINPIGPGTLYWIDPVEAPPISCVPANNSATSTVPFTCQGKVAWPVAAASTVYTNTGKSVPLLEALDSRFGSYGTEAKCDPATAPPDRNIKEFNYDDPAVAAWMSPSPKNYLSPIHGNTCKAIKGECQASRVGAVTGSPPVIPTDDGGVVWSFARPQGDIPGSSRMPTASYPATGTPYTSSTGPFYESGGANGVFERRVLNMMIVACPTLGGVCHPAPVLGIGRFLMQRKANVPSDKDVYIEFGGVISPGQPKADIRLYR